MALTADNNLGLPVYVVTGETGWGPEYNDAMELLDAIVMLSVKAQQAAPGTQTLGFRYLVAPSGSGAWAGQDGNIAIWRSDDGAAAGWKFISPKEGWLIFDETLNLFYVAGDNGDIAVNGRKIRLSNAAVAQPIVVDPSDPTKELRFDISAVSTGIARTATWPDKAVTVMTSTGDTMTGALAMGDNEVTRPILKDVAHKGQTGDQTTLATIDLTAGNAAHIVLTGNLTTLAFSNWPAAGAGHDLGECIVSVEQGSLGTYTVGYAAAVRWPGGVAPVITVGVGKVDILRFRTWDGGTTVYGEVVAQNYN